MPKSTPTFLHVPRETLARVRDVLEEHRELCIDELRNCVQKDGDDPLERTRDTFLEVFRLMARGLRAAALHCVKPSRACEEGVSPERLDIYFWPGYLWGDEERPERLAFKCKGNGWQCGIGVGSDGIEYDCNNAAKWFHILLDPGNDYGKLGGREFVPAGTHAWATKVGINPPRFTCDPEGVERTNLLLTVLAVIDNKQFITPAPDLGQLSVGLDTGDPSHYGHNLSSFLNVCPCLNYEIRWPCLADHKAPTYGRMDNIEELPKTESDRIRTWEELYSIWLAACFQPGFPISCSDWIAAYARQWQERDPDLRPLADRVIAHVGQNRSNSNCLAACAGERDPNAHRGRYKAWYTVMPGRVPSRQRGSLADGNRLSYDKSSELGSAMLLSSFVLQEEFFLLAKPWIEEIYLLMRQMEDAVRIEVSARAEAKERAKRQTQQELATYARGASHSLKNALATPMWRMRDVAEVFDEYRGEEGWGAQIAGNQALYHASERIGLMVEEASIVLRDLDFLRRQAQMMFWIMDPKRMQSELRARLVEPWLQADIIECLVLATAAGISKVEESRLEGVSKDTLTRSVLRAADSATDAQLSAALNEAFIGLLKISIRLSDSKVQKTDKLVAESILFELITNAVARALPTKGTQIPSFSVVMTTDRLGVNFTIENSASSRDARRLTRNWGKEMAHEEEGSRGISGVHQITLLESKAAEYARSRVRLLAPKAVSYGAISEVTSGLTIQKRLRRRNNSAYSGD